MSNTYQKNLSLFESRNGSLTIFNQHHFRASPVEETIRLKLKQYLTVDELQSFDDYIAHRGNGAIRTECGLHGQESCLYPLHDPRWELFQHSELRLGPSTYYSIRSYWTGIRPPPPLSVTGTLYYVMNDIYYLTNHGINNGAWYYGMGWLTNQQSFESLKRKLPLIDVRLTPFESALASEGPCALRGDSKAVLFTTDMLIAGYLGHFESLQDMRDTLQQWTCGNCLAWLNTGMTSPESLSTLIENKTVSQCRTEGYLSTSIHAKTVSEINDTLYGVHMDVPSWYGRIHSYGSKGHNEAVLEALAS